MSKKQFDHIENKIREAAENSEPVFEEQAWDKMEVKLDNERDRRRSPFLWFSLSLLMFAGLGGIIFFNNQSQKIKVVASSLSATSTGKDEAPASATVDNTSNQANNKSSSTITDKSVINSSATDNFTKGNSVTTGKNGNGKTHFSASTQNGDIQETSNQHTIVSVKNKSGLPSNIDNASAYNGFNKKEIVAGISGSKKFSRVTSSRTGETHRKKAAEKADDVMSYASSQKIKRTIHGRTKATIKAGGQDEETAVAATHSAATGEVAADNDDNKKTISSIDKTKRKDSIAKIASKDTIAIRSIKKEEVVQKDTKQKRSPWYLLASIGADASNVSLFSFNNSSITATYGVGIGYQINKKISIQTGFYAGRKKYIAGPGDYNSKNDPYLSTLDITKVNANCFIYEIPVSVRYNFVLRPKTTYYATAGISSFIMKSEAYDYSFTTGGGNYQIKQTYTGNDNLFSIVTVSVGIERKLSKAFSIQAEPSVNIPIAGVGEGTVKLYSTDIQVGVKYNFHW